MNSAQTRSFWINTNTWQLAANTFISGQFVARAPLLDINSPTLDVTLTDFAAGGRPRGACRHRWSGRIVCPSGLPDTHKTASLWR